MEALKSIVCLNCGGEVEISADGKEATCKYCRRTYKIGSTLKDSALISFSLATEYWKNFHFQKAKEKFLDVAKNNPKFSEAWWGAFVSEYGIEFGYNRFGDKVPTCHRAHTVNVSDDPNYIKAVETADEANKEEYVTLGNEIERIRAEIIDKSKDEESYDVFICFKATEINAPGKTTDYYLGEEIYHELKREGYNVFFSAETLVRIGEQDFEPYIFKALSTAKVMLVLCSDNEKIESAWVKNEWGRFLDMHGGKGLIPICGNNRTTYTPYELPEELRKLNAIEYDGKLFEKLKTKIEAYFPERVKARKEAEKKAREAEYDSRYAQKIKEIEEQNAKEREAERQAQDERTKQLEEQLKALMKQMQGFAATPKEENRAPERAKPQEESRAPERTKPAYTKNGKKITFGEYPQTKVTDSGLISTLNSLAGSLPTEGKSPKWTSYGYYIEGKVNDYMWYIDVESGGERYRGVYFISYRPGSCTLKSSEDNSKQDDNGYTVNNVYWFKFEPIQWTVLSETGGNALILCDMIIDSREYDYDGNYSNNYAESTVRAWLNDSFYNTAFNDLQKAIILATEVDNSVSSTGYSENQYACENTNDKVFLLSYAEVTNSAYGFDSNSSAYDTARQKKTTDYAQSQGAYTYSSSSSDYKGNGWWWLRSPHDYISSLARDVDRGGHVNNFYVYFTYYGVVPALQIRL